MNQINTFYKAPASMEQTKTSLSPEDYLYCSQQPLQAQPTPLAQRAVEMTTKTDELNRTQRHLRTRQGDEAWLQEDRGLLQKEIGKLSELEISGLLEATKEWKLSAAAMGCLCEVIAGHLRHAESHVLNGTWDALKATARRIQGYQRSSSLSLIEIAIKSREPQAK